MHRMVKLFQLATSTDLSVCGRDWTIFWAALTSVLHHLLRSLAGLQIVKQMHRAAQLGYRHLHLTDGVPPDPWAALPSYWRQLVVAVNGEAPRNDAADGDRS